MTTLSTVPASPPRVSSEPPAEFCGVPMHALHLREALSILSGWTGERSAHQVCFCNAYTLTEFQRNPEFRSVIQKADLVLADGTSLVWTSGLLGLHLPERVAGPDLMEAF